MRVGLPTQRAKRPTANICRKGKAHCWSLLFGTESRLARTLTSFSAAAERMLRFFGKSA